MADTGIRVGLVGLFGLALVTASNNVSSIQRSYRIAELERSEQDLRLMINHRRDVCLRLLRTASLASSAATRGWTNEEMYPPMPDPRWLMPMPMPMAFAPGVPVVSLDNVAAVELRAQPGVP